MTDTHVQTVLQFMERHAPKRFAVEGDPIGLQIGSVKKRTAKIMVTLDVLEPVVDEAIANGVDMIIAHHPLLFRPIKQLNTDTSYGRAVEKLIKHDVTVFAAHTNLDVADGGVNDMMANALGIRDTKPLAPVTEDSLKKIAVFVPRNHADAVREALGQAGAGHIGDYSHCSFSTDGKGAFVPGSGANPYIGSKGSMERPEEERIETVFPASIERNVIRAMLDAHPYEEAAYDIYSLENPGKTYGLGRIGKLDETITLREFTERVKQAFGVNGLRVVGDLDKKVKKAAVLGGDGNKYTMHALREGADVYVTGDLYFHVAHDAWMEGLAMIDPGHHVEQIMKKELAEQLQSWLEEQKSSTEVIISEINTDPFQFL
ncbi:Nif3-like dinuclear metal center hexameric protein [Alkalicoccus luteus]|uniref:GTP cyclohydrolase 1 type 2 homolog n=1 Tax=Alkalicoccus luteus TaxID=1237094 RepID=A0A969PNY7_9BACI|nr:Nif3-like dinuclear metal center hexameric protein [Alkalicoccus luteus]NJP37700.1 Nif3-like dinuclear metal center hexameric protein [Alkalicoccus luteus]